MVGLRAKRPHFTEKWLRFTLHFVAHFYSARNNAVFGCEDFVSPFAREVVPNHFQFEPEVEFPHMPSKVVSNSWGSVHFRGDSPIQCVDYLLAALIVLKKHKNAVRFAGKLRENYSRG